MKYEMSLKGVNIEKKSLTHHAIAVEANALRVRCASMGMHAKLGDAACERVAKDIAEQIDDIRARTDQKIAESVRKMFRSIYRQHTLEEVTEDLGDAEEFEATLSQAVLPGSDAAHRVQLQSYGKNSTAL